MWTVQIKIRLHKTSKDQIPRLDMDLPLTLLCWIYSNSITCIQRPLKGSNVSVLLQQVVFNPFPRDRILDQTKLKAFADDKLNVTKMIISVCDKLENIVGKGEIACISNFSFSFSHYVFKSLLSQTRQKVTLCWNGLNAGSIRLL